MSAETIGELNGIFQNEFKKLRSSRDLEVNKVFPIACRNYARAIRKTKVLLNFNIGMILGYQYEIINNISLSSFSIQCTRIPNQRTSRYYFAFQHWNRQVLH